MSGINKVILIGNLGRDPEGRYTQGGTPVTRLSVATTRAWTNRDTGERVEETEWHRITVWGKQAEHCSKYLTKGRSVYIEGRLRTSKYTKDGIDHWSTEIVAETVQFLGKNPNAIADDRPQGSERNTTPPPYDPLPIDNDDDIPF